VAEVEAAEAKRQRQRDALEMAACIGGIGMQQKSMEADGVDGADGASGEYKVSEAVKAVTTCRNLLGQDGTCLGLLLLHVGPNGDRFGGQAFMEHYTGQGDNDNLMLLALELFSIHIWLNGSDIATNRPSAKLSHCHLGPFTIKAHVSLRAYHLNLPFSLHRLEYLVKWKGYDNSYNS
jgi:hypothetical protein